MWEPNTEVRDTTLTYQQVRHDGDGQIPVVEAPRSVAIHANFGFELDDLPLLGPGAKMQVTFTDTNDAPFEAYKFWRRTVAQPSVPVISVTNAVAVLESFLAGADGTADTSRFTVLNVRLGHYALPPRSLQRFLIPAYAFSCSGNLDTGQTLSFTRYIAAADVSDGEIKSLCAPLDLRNSRLF